MADGQTSTAGRFAPSPTGDLHLGNLRTALAAWLAARSTSSAFWLRFEDLDDAAVRSHYYTSQAHDLAAIGLDWNEPVLVQSDRLDHYRSELERLVASGAAYPCYCSRREIAEAARAPNGQSPERRAAGSVQAADHSGHRYPGTCRDLSSAQRADRAQSRPAALRLRADGEIRTVDDLVAGPSTFNVDDFVISRNDGTPAYHLVVVVDDHAQGVEQVVRADDLLESAARQIVLHEHLELPQPSYAHVPLVLGEDGDRLAKRHGSVTLSDRLAAGQSAEQVLGYLGATLGLLDIEPGQLASPHRWPKAQPSDFLDRFSWDIVSRQPLVLPSAVLEASDPVA